MTDEKRIDDLDKEKLDGWKVRWRDIQKIILNLLKN